MKDLLPCKTVYDLTIIILIILMCQTKLYIHTKQQEKLIVWYEFLIFTFLYSRRIPKCNMLSVSLGMVY